MADQHPQASSKTENGDAVITLTDISKSFVSGRRTIQALHKVSVFVLRNRITGLVGPDGSGKTTLMRLIVGLLAPDKGKVTVLGRDATVESLTIQASVGYMPQRFGLYEDLTVLENILFYADIYERWRKNSE